MSKKSKRKIDLKTAILILLLLAALLFASTYAWFTANRVVSVSNIDVRIEAQSGLQISADGEHWKSTLTVDDLKTAAYSGNSNQLPSTMEPVSTVGEVDTATGFMKMFYGKVDSKDNGFALTATAEPAETAGTTGRFVAFDIFLQVNQPEPNVILGENSTVTFKGTAGNEGLQNAARVAFLKQGHAEIGAPASSFTGLHGAESFLTQSGDTTELWEPNSDVHTTAAVAAAKSNYDIDTTTTDAEVIEYYGINQAITEAVDLGDTNDGTDAKNFTKVTPSIITDAAMADYDNAFSLEEGITKIRVYMWIEGQDVDCENNASGSDITFKLEFKVPDETAGG